MYLSKVDIPWRSARNPYDIHRALWTLFPGRPVGSRDFLFRIEQQHRGLSSGVLLQSGQMPNESNSSPHIKAVREYLPALRKGQRLRFRLRANPVKTINDEKGRLNQKGEPKKCRVPLIREEEQKAWVVRKLEPFCSIETLIIRREMPLFFRKSKVKQTGKIQTVLFDGIINLRDPDTFLTRLKEGIGPAKAFGCGLLSIAKAR